MKILKKILQKLSIDSPDLDLIPFAFMKSPLALVITDNNGKILHVNHSFFELYGYSNLELIDKSMSILKSGKHDNAFYKELWSEFEESNKHSFEIFNRCKDDTVVLIQEHVTSFMNNNNEYFISTHENITDKKKLSDEYKYLATHDLLTGLANRKLLYDRFSHASLNTLRNNKRISLILCDINEFKDINDDYGHNFGDTVLVKIANKLKELVRDCDTVSRYGGDEFVIIMEQVDNTNKHLNAIDKIKSSFPISLEIKESTCDVNVSIGHATFPDDGDNFEQLLNIADINMYEDKKRFYEN